MSDNPSAQKHRQIGSDEEVKPLRAKIPQLLQKNTLLRNK